LGFSLATGVLGRYYIKSHPLVFNESLFEHAHCMPQAGLTLLTYAEEHQGRFPFHTNGYGDALLQMLPEPTQFYILTGPGYDDTVYREALDSGKDVDENRCGRVYVQGLSRSNDSRIAILFDKVAAPPDHCHFPRRLWHEYVREVFFVDGSYQAIPTNRWPEFAHQQIDLLMAAGFSREQARSVYAESK
jgi:hypothetical protein